MLNDLMVRAFKYKAATSYRCSVYKDLWETEVPTTLHSYLT